MSSKISADSFKKPIESGSYVVEAPNLGLNQALSNPSRASLQNQNSNKVPTAAAATKVAKSRAAVNQNREAGKQQVIQTGFKSSTNSKIPLLSKERGSKREKPRKATEPNEVVKQSSSAGKQKSS